MAIASHARGAARRLHHLLDEREHPARTRRRHKENSARYGSARACDLQCRSLGRCGRDSKDSDLYLAADSRRPVTLSKLPESAATAATSAPISKAYPHTMTASPAQRPAVFSCTTGCRFRNAAVDAHCDDRNSPRRGRRTIAPPRGAAAPRAPASWPELSRRRSQSPGIRLRADGWFGDGAAAWCAGVEVLEVSRVVAACPSAG